LIQVIGNETSLVIRPYFRFQKDMFGLKEIISHYQMILEHSGPFLSDFYMEKLKQEFGQFQRPHCYEPGTEASNCCDAPIVNATS
jgi:hypothetical protein